MNIYEHTGNYVLNSSISKKKQRSFIFILIKVTSSNKKIVFPKLLIATEKFSFKKYCFKLNRASMMLVYLSDLTTCILLYHCTPT